MPKKSVVASFVGNFSPVKRRTAIFVRSVRHFRGEMGEVLNRRAVEEGQPGGVSTATWRGRTVLEHGGAVQLEALGLRVFIFLCVAHVGR